MTFTFDGSEAELASLFSLIRSEPVTPEQVAKLEVALDQQTKTSAEIASTLEAQK